VNTDKLKQPDAPLAFPERRFIGVSMKRREDPSMLRGGAKYVADLDVPGTLDVAFVRSEVAHATIRNIDVDSALAVPGVVAVYTAADLDSVQPLVDFLPEGSIKTPRLPLATDRVRYVGEPIVAVVAENRYIAEDAAQLVVVDYDELPAVTSIADATANGATLVQDHVPSNTWFTQLRTFGPVEQSFARAAKSYSKTLHIQRHLAVPLECRAILAQVDPVNGDLTCWMSNQMPYGVRFLLSMALRLPEGRIRVVAPAVGGSFGQKDFAQPEDIVVAFIALRLAKPIRWIEDRVENLKSAPHSKEMDVTLEIGVTDEGRITAMRGSFTSDTGAFVYHFVGGQVDTQYAAHSVIGPYDVPAYEYESAGVLTNKPHSSAVRGVGFTAANTIRELLLDEIARDLAIDPLELRRKNMLAGEPVTTIAGANYDGGTYKESLDLAAEMLHSGPSRVPDGKLRGVGFGPFIEMNSIGRRAGQQGGLEAPSYDNFEIRLDLAGQFTVGVGTSSHGQGHHTSFAQMAADALGVDIAEVTIVDSDTSRSPWGMGSFASRSAVFASGGVLRAAAQLKAKLFQLAAALMEIDPTQVPLELRSGEVGVKGAPGGIPLADLAQAALFGPGRDILDDPNLVGRAFYDAEPTYSNGCIAVEVAVDPDTFEVEIVRAVAVEDCGTILNPKIVDGQVLGGFVAGIGAALLESYLFGEDGQPLTTTFLDYLVPVASDSPGLEIAHLVTPSPTNELGVKGTAEGSSIGTPGAILCAIADALAPLGVKIEKLPYRPSDAFSSAGRFSA